MSEAPKPTILPRLRLMPKRGWPELALPSQAVLVDVGPLRLGLLGAQPIAMNESFGSFGGRRLPRGLTIGFGGRIFLADPATGVVHTALAGELGLHAQDVDAFRPLWPPRKDPADPYRLVAPSDVAIGPRDTLLIADPGTAKVLVIDWPSAAVRKVIALPGWTPTALAIDARGRIYVADPDANTVHRFDANWHRDPNFPHSATVLQRPAYLALSAAAHDECGCHCSSDGESLCGTCQAMGPAPPVLYVLGAQGLTALTDQGRVTVAQPGTLYPPSLQQSGRGWTWADPAFPVLEPLLIRFRELTRDGRLPGLNLPLIARPRRIPVPRFGNATFQPFDGDRRGFPWDRVAFDLTMPSNGSLVVETLTSDSPFPTDQLDTQFDGIKTTPLTIGPGDLPEILIQSPPGRYLWLRLTMICDGSASPQIHRIDIFGPRKSSLTRLPAPFHQDPQSRDFLDRFLSYFDTIFAELRAANRETAALFDPGAVPEGAWLNWLGSWFDLTFLAEWDVATRREMVAMAVEQARLRGTREGIARMLRWHLNLDAPWPMMIEHFALGPSSPPLAHQPLPNAPEPHKVTIVIPRARVDEVAEPRLRRLVDDWLPAHVGAELVFLDAGIVIGCQSLLGIDTLLGCTSQQPLGRARIGLSLSTQTPSGGAVIQSHTLDGAHHVSSIA